VFRNVILNRIPGFALLGSSGGDDFSKVSGLYSGDDALGFDVLIVVDNCG
jgi:hypothetical protein